MIFLKMERMAHFRVHIKRRLRLRGLDWNGPFTMENTAKLLHFYIAVLRDDLRVTHIDGITVNVHPVRESYQFNQEDEI